MICWSTPTLPVPVATCAGGTSKRSASACTRPVANMSGYRFIRLAAAAAASRTPGNGGYGFSLDDSLINSAAPELSEDAVRPGRYDGSASNAARSRTDCAGAVPGSSPSCTIESTVEDASAHTYHGRRRWDIVAAVLSFIVRLFVTGVAIWVASEIIGGVTLGPSGDTTQMVLTLAGVSLIFTEVNALVRPVVVLLSLPAYILTLGLFTFVVNALMLWLTSWIAGQFDLDFNVDGFFWAAVLGSLVISLVSWVLSLVLPKA